MKLKNAVFKPGHAKVNDTGPYQPNPNAPVIDANRGEGSPESCIDSATAAELKEVTNPARDADRQELRRHRQERVEKRSADELQAERIRAENRAEVARHIEENRLAREKAEEERKAAKKREEEAELRNVTSWEAQFRQLLTEFDLVLTKGLVSSLIIHGKLINTVKSKALQVEQQLNDWDRTFTLKGQWSPAGFRSRQIEIIKANEQGLRDGFPEMKDLPSEEEFSKQASVQRSLIRARMGEISDSINPVLLDLAQSLQNAARVMASELLTAERRTADEWGVNFRPSCILNAVVWAGYNLCRVVKENWLASSMSCPRESLYGILDPRTNWE